MTTCGNSKFALLIGQIFEQNRTAMDALAGPNDLDEIAFQIYAAEKGLMI